MVVNAMVIPLSWPPTLLSFVDQRSLWMLIFDCVPERKNLVLFSAMIKRRFIMRLINFEMPRELGGMDTRHKLEKVTK